VTMMDVIDKDSSVVERSLSRLACSRSARLGPGLATWLQFLCDEKFYPTSSSSTIEIMLCYHERSNAGLC
jgi:hypothetical protein